LAETALSAMRFSSSSSERNNPSMSGVRSMV
jgi:hypothetical protein